MEPSYSALEPLLWTVPTFCQFCVESCVHMIWWRRCNERGVNRKQVLMPLDSHTYYAQRMLAIQCEIQFLVARRITSVVAFGFLSQNFENVILSLYDCSLIGRDTQRWWGHSNLTSSNRKIWTFCTHRWQGMQNISLIFESPGKTFTIFKLLSLLLKMINENFLKMLRHLQIHFRLEKCE